MIRFIAFAAGIRQPDAFIPPSAWNITSPMRL
jgi:hypothetical protein